MTKLIEVINVRDSYVLDGIIHGAHHRNKEATDKMREARKLNQTDIFEEHKRTLHTRPFIYVDVTEKAAESALFAKLRRDPIAIKAVGIHSSPAHLRGNTFNGVNLIMSESLQVIDAHELSTSLAEMFKSIRMSSTATFPTRVYVPVEFSEKFDNCMESWIIKEELSLPQSGGIAIRTGDTNSENELIRNLAIDSLMEFIVNKKGDSKLRGTAWSIDPELELAFSDYMLSRLENIMRFNKATLYISSKRYTSFVLGKYYRSTGVIA